MQVPSICQASSARRQRSDLTDFDSHCHLSNC